jgi:anti-sigma factor RsiW
MSESKKDHRLEDIMMYAQGSLDDQERAELEEHLRGCPECQASLEEVQRFLPALQKALVPDEPSAEELLAWAKARMLEKARAKEAQPAGFFTRMRVAVVGFGLAAASAIVIALQTLVGPGTTPSMAHSEGDAGANRGYVAAPHGPEPEVGPDAGPDAGLEESKDKKGGEIK